MTGRKVDSAVILAAGIGSRMRPLSKVMPKALLTVRGEVLIERLICQLREKGITRIAIVTGYMAEKFRYLEEKYGVTLLYNPEYQTRNTWYSLWIAKEYLPGSYICSGDYYYFSNPFCGYEDRSYYETVAPGTEGAVRGVSSEEDGLIIRTNVPAEEGQWMMFGHSFFDEDFGRKYAEFLETACSEPEKAGFYWEQIYAEHLSELMLYEKRIDSSHLAELDTPSELEAFDPEWAENNPWAKELKQ